MAVAVEARSTSLAPRADRSHNHSKLPPIQKYDNKQFYRQNENDHDDLALKSSGF
jgi:hypothetical protein